MLLRNSKVAVTIRLSKRSSILIPVGIKIELGQCFENEEQCEIQGRSQRGARGPGPPDKVLAPLIGLGRYIESF